jgi:hypothetical protein
MHELLEEPREAFVPGDVLDSDVSSNAIRLYGMLSTYVGADLTATVPRQILASRMRVSPQTLDRALRELVEVGAIEVAAQFVAPAVRTASRYRLLLTVPAPIDLTGRAPLRCVDCGTELDPTADHLVPRALGGTDDPSNITPRCRPCNAHKGARPGVTA